MRISGIARWAHGMFAMLLFVILMCLIGILVISKNFIKMVAHITNAEWVNIVFTIILASRRKQKLQDLTAVLNALLE
jgi:hypothetical protein